LVDSLMISMNHFVAHAHEAQQSETVLGCTVKYNVIVIRSPDVRNLDLKTDLEMR